MRRGAKMCLIALAIALGVRYASAKSVPPTACLIGTALASERKKAIFILLGNQHGKLTGSNNNPCLAFRKAEISEPADVQSVSMEFALLVGRIQERLVKAQLTRVGAGCYHGTVDLGRQYYKPANYYVFIRYTDSTRIKRKIRFLLTVE